MYERQLSTRQVSILTGISKSTISRIVNGKKCPDMNMMERLAAGLKIRISDLYSSDLK